METVAVVLAGLLGLAWYAQGQLLHSLRFLYQLTILVFPELATLLGRP